MNEMKGQSKEGEKDGDEYPANWLRKRWREPELCISNQTTRRLEMLYGALGL